MHNLRLLEELSDRAFKIYLENPENDYARQIMIESNKLFLSVQEARKKNDDSENEPSGNEQDGDSENKEKNNEPEEPEMINLFGDDEVFSNVEISSVEPVDPPLGLKAGLCFDSVTNYQLAIIKNINNSGGSDAIDLLFGDNWYEEYEKTKRGGKGKRKYTDVIKQVDTARIPTSGQERREFAFDLASNPEKQNFIVKYTGSQKKVFIAHKNYGMEKYISYDLGTGKIYNLGAGQLEFLARIFYMSTGGAYPGIASKILVSEDRAVAEKKEKELFELAPQTTGYNCLRILRQYLTMASRRILEPIIQKRHFHDFIPSGVDAVINELKKGRYRFEEANLARWAFQVIKNEAIDLLKPMTDYDLDVDRAYDFASNQTFPLTFYSKANPDEAKALREKIRNFTQNDQASFSAVDPKKVINIGKDKFFLYTYDNRESFFEDIKRANGYYDNAEAGYTMDKKLSQGAPLKTLKQSPVYMANTTKEFRKRFMTSFPKTRFMQPEEPEIVQTKGAIPSEEIREKAAVELSSLMTTELKSIIDEIYDKIVSAPAKQNMYGHKNIVSYMKDNPQLTKRLMLAILNYGVYKFQKDNWLWFTAPQKYGNEFLMDIENSGYEGQGMPSSVKNTNGNEMQMYVKGTKGGFLKELKRVLIGAEKFGRQLADLALQGDEESDERYKQLTSQGAKGETQQSVGFLLREPAYLRRIYETMQAMHADEVVGREGVREPKKYQYEPPDTKSLGVRNVDESIKNIKKLIFSIDKQITIEKNKINSNFLKSWN